MKKTKQASALPTVKAAKPVAINQVKQNEKSTTDRNITTTLPHIKAPVMIKPPSSSNTASKTKSNPSVIKPKVAVSVATPIDSTLITNTMRYASTIACDNNDIDELIQSKTPKESSSITSEADLVTTTDHAFTTDASISSDVNTTAAPIEVLESDSIAPAPVINNAIDKELMNGDVIIIYELYNESFPIIDGVLTAAAIDNVYCLSFTMPHCTLHLSVTSPSDCRRLIEEGLSDLSSLYIPEEPPGT